LINIVCGVISGASANALANPTDVLKVRMQSAENKNGKMFKAFKDIYVNEGIFGLYRVDNN
jgi:hypothetical protein